MGTEEEPNKVEQIEVESIPQIVLMYKPKPPPFFKGMNDYKVVEDWFYDMKDYFRVLWLLNLKKVLCAKPYLRDNVKFWWKTTKANEGLVVAWEIIKARICATYVLPNTTLHLRDELNRLKQMGTIQEYMNAFMAKRIFVTDMDAFHAFILGLQTWA